MVRRAAVDLRDVVEAQHKKISEFEASMDDLADEADSYGSYEDVPDSIVHLYDELAERRDEFEAIANATDARLDEYEENDLDSGGWENTTVRLKELTIGDVCQIQDRTGVQVQDAGDAFEAGEGAATAEALRLTIERLPEGAPDDPADLPIPIAQLIFLKSGELGGLDPLEQELGKSSLRARMEN